MIDRIIEFSAKNRFLVILVFAALSGLALQALSRTPLDALPDLSDTQVIVYSRWDQSPGIVEDQVTYPIITALLGAPKVKTIRGLSDYGSSFVYVIFEDGTDIYWARSRVLEYLSQIQSSLPEGVTTELGPDATGIGWVFQYVLIDRSGNHDLAELRDYQDWNLRYRLQSVPGVSEVASYGGYVTQYQINIHPGALAGYDIPLSRVIDGIRRSNSETGGRVVEFSGREYMIRGRGYVEGLADLKNLAVGLDEKTGTPILLKQIADVRLGPDMRRGVADYNGMGDAPGGIVVMRHGENALAVINRIKDRIEEIKPTLPEGMEIVITYDRSDLILRSIDTLKHTLTEEMVIVSVLIMIFLWHIPSAIVAVLTIPISVLLAFIPFYLMGLTANIMSLAGIAISVGVLVDGAIVEVENAYRKIEQWNATGRKEDFYHVRLSAMKEVGPSVFFSLLVIAIAFLPIFTLVDQEGRLFTPLAWSKNLAMAVAALLAVSLDPAIRMLFSRYKNFNFKNRFLNRVANGALVGTYYSEKKHPVSRVLIRYYEPVVRRVLAHPVSFVLGAIVLSLLTLPVYRALGNEFMPPLNEGTILYMPTTLPGISVAEAERALQIQDRVLKSFPEVEHVHGKIGRAVTATDPAPLSMAETVVLLKPESAWRKKHRWYSDLPGFIQPVFRIFQSDRITFDELTSEMDARLKMPGWTNAFTMPIRARLDMLTTGIRTPVGIKVYGDDLKKIEWVGKEIEKILRGMPGARSVYAERPVGGMFIDYDLDRRALARYGLTVEDAQNIISSAVGGKNITTTVEGRKRHPVNVRYAREFRDEIQDLERVLVPLPSGAHIPIGSIATIHTRSGPSMIRDENGLLAGYVFIDVEGRDVGSFVEDAKIRVRSHVLIPPGMSLEWAGQYKNMIRVKENLKTILPITLFMIFLLIYLNTRSVIKTGIILLAVPFSIIGAVWFLYILDYNISIAVWVGMIALMGLDAETGSFMLLYLDLSWKEAKENGKLNSLVDLREAIVEGAAHRIRPKAMTVLSGMIGLIPVLWSTGAGADLMKRIAAPMVGGLTTSFVLELLIYPALYYLWKKRDFREN